MDIDLLICQAKKIEPQIITKIVMTPSEYEFHEKHTKPPASGGFRTVEVVESLPDGNREITLLHVPAWSQDLNKALELFVEIPDASISYTNCWHITRPDDGSISKSYHKDLCTAITYEWLTWHHLKDAQTEEAKG